jgi:hypothetical protein
MTGTSEYVKRAIEVTFRLTGTQKPITFGTGHGTNNTATFSGMRIQAHIRKVGGSSMPTAEVRAYGLPLSVMNALSTIGKYLYQSNGNEITIKAGNVGGPLSTVFVGNIQQAFFDAAEAPDIAFVVVAYVGPLQMMAPIPPTSYAGSVDAAVVLQRLATTMGLSFENSLPGPVMLSGGYYPGTARQQAEAVARAAGISIFYDDTTGTMAVFPKNGSRNTRIPLISPETGLIGYPIYQQAGMTFTTLYNPQIVCNGKVKIQSTLQPACGTWTTISLDHTLESETPDGAWFTVVQCMQYGFVPDGG